MFDGQLRFRFGDIARELREAEKLAGGFLHRGSASRLTTAAEQLELLRHRPGAHEWGVPASAPLLTHPSPAYEQDDRQGAHELQAAIDSTWRITVEDTKLFRVTGNVSTRVRLLDGDQGSELGRWRVELGAEGAPGCFFHSQIRGQEEDDEPPWPHSVPVPRFPSPFMSIPAVVTFVLGELFQSEWARHVADKRSQRLAADQRRDWQRRLRWESAVIERNGTLPWSALKQALPHRDLFVASDVGREVLIDG